MLLGNYFHNIKKNYKNFVSIIIPRHVNRKEEIIDILKKFYDKKKFAPNF